MGPLPQIQDNRRISEVHGCRAGMSAMPDCLLELATILDDTAVRLVPRMKRVREKR
jgi:hypothetical protein